MVFFFLKPEEQEVVHMQWHQLPCFRIFTDMSMDLNYSISSSCYCQHAYLSWKSKVLLWEQSYYGTHLLPERWKEKNEIVFRRLWNGMFWQKACKRKVQMWWHMPNNISISFTKKVKQFRWFVLGFFLFWLFRITWLSLSDNKLII